MPMVQAYAEEVLNQKDAESATDRSYVSDALFLATERLLNALDRLEQGMELALVQPVSSDISPESVEKLAFYEQENEALRAEREALNSAVGQLREQYGDLHHTASGIYNKLEDSIRRLTQIMKE